MRTYTVCGHITLMTNPINGGGGGGEDSSSSMGGSISHSSSGGTNFKLPSIIYGSDVDERGVVVGQFTNLVTDAYVGTLLRYEFAVELSEEAKREGRKTSSSSNGGGSSSTTYRLDYDIVADPADWAITGLTKGTLDFQVGRGSGW